VQALPASGALGGEEVGPISEDVSLAELDAEGYRALFDFSPDGVLFTSPDGPILAANPAACEIFGRTEEELRAVGRQGVVDASDERWVKMLQERESTGHSRGIARVIHRDGSTAELEITSRVFTDALGQQRTCTVFRDVTERVRIETELRNSRARLSEAERVAQIGSWEWDLVANSMAWSEGLFHLYGLTREQFDPTFEGGLHRVFPDDREAARAGIMTAVAERSSFSLEFRAMRADGRVRTLRSQGDAVVNEAGEVVRLIGVVQDITHTLPGLEIGLGGGRPPGMPVPLTPRQLEIVQLIADGLTNAGIGERLVVSEGTVKWHVKQILAKTGSANRTEAVARLLGETRARE
jgi:PAS domain S-box-containing protein